MGRPKALIEIDGVPLALRVAQALVAAGAVGVELVGDPGQLAARDVPWPVVPDDQPGQGPLAATASTLRRATVDYTAILACDLLDPSPAAIRTLVAHTASDADAVVPVVDGRAQWMHGLWHRRIADLLTRSIRAGERSMVGATAGLRVEYVEGLDPAATADADKPADLPHR